MSATEAQSVSRDAAVGQVDMHFEVHTIPVSDVDRAKHFYLGLGWRLDLDDAPLDGLRIVQFTPPGSRPSTHACRATRSKSCAYTISRLRARHLSKHGPLSADQARICLPTAEVGSERLLPAGRTPGGPETAAARGIPLVLAPVS
jgi:hypothetical protein